MSGPGTTVLVVAENAEARNEMKSTFQMFGWQAVVAENPSVAMAALTKDPKINMIVVDVKSPISGSFEFVREASRISESEKPIFLVCDRLDPYVNEAFYEGVEAVFVKPLTFESIAKGVAVSYASILGHTTRRHDRLRVRRARVTYEIGAEKILGYATNISEGGLFIGSMGTLPRSGQIIKFKMTIEGHDIRGEGRVRWLRAKLEYGRPPGFGIQFVTMDAKSSEIMKAIFANQD